MSVAYDLDFAADSLPVEQPRRSPLTLVGQPAPTRPGHGVRPDEVRAPAVAVQILRPLPDEVALRLTRRGIAVIAMVVAALGAGVIAFAAHSAPTSSARFAGPAVVTVQPGDTLWSIASASAPGRDPQAEITTIERLNHLRTERLVPGQQLRVR